MDYVRLELKRVSWLERATKVLCLNQIVVKVYFFRQRLLFGTLFLVLQGLKSQLTSMELMDILQEASWCNS